MGFLRHREGIEGQGLATYLLVTLAGVELLAH